MLHDILRKAHELDASDIHLVAGNPPTVRINTVMTPMDLPMLTAEDTRRMLGSAVSTDQAEQFARARDLDFSYEIAGFKRYRVNAHLQRGVVGLALRAIRTKVPALASLNLPEVITRLTYLPRGLVLVTGDTGSGKSTTLAAMIQAMNERYRKHIITLEDPVEYTFTSDRCLIEQRELLAQIFPLSRAAYATRFVKILTSSSSVKCAILKPARSRSLLLRLVTWCSPRCTP